MKAAADGYTLLLVDTSNAFKATLYDSLSFNFMHDVAPVASVFRGAGVPVVRPAVPANTTAEVIAYAKADPSKVTLASAGIGSYPQPQLLTT